MDKAPDAFRTISEVADHLETPAHVLRFWESRFPQIRPVKRAGGRRYYRPADVALLTGIKRLLHDEGLTIRGVQKILREQGVRHVAGLSGDAVADEMDQTAEAALEAAMAANFGTIDQDPIEPERAKSATIVALETALRTSDPDLGPEPDADPDLRRSGAVDADPWKAAQSDLFAAADTAPPAAPAPPPVSVVRDHPWIAKSDLAAALRALPAHAFAGQMGPARVLQMRLQALHDLLSAPPRFADL